jgi:hypothetical protein
MPRLAVEIHGEYSPTIVQPMWQHLNHAVFTLPNVLITTLV